MAQLIKLYDYPSRYETNVYRYSSRFMQIKSRRYQSYVTDHRRLYNDENALKLAFLNDFIKSQFIWATSSLHMESSVNVQVVKDPFLEKLMKVLDDTALIIYRPTFEIDGTEVDSDLVILTPMSVWCIKCLFGEKESVFQGVNAREWKEITSSGLNVIKNPYIDLSKSVNAIRKIFDKHDMEAAIKGGVLAPESYVEFAQYGSDYEIIDYTKFQDWTDKINHHRSTLKHGQLRAAEILLDQAKTSGRLRI
ncbi:MAG: hypothetical protein ACO1OC_10515 [Tuberibacillus sp.]